MSIIAKLNEENSVCLIPQELIDPIIVTEEFLRKRARKSLQAININACIDRFQRVWGLQIISLITISKRFREVLGLITTAVSAPL